MAGSSKSGRRSSIGPRRYRHAIPAIAPRSTQSVAVSRPYPRMSAGKIRPCPRNPRPTPEAQAAGAVKAAEEAAVRVAAPAQQRGRRQ